MSLFISSCSLSQSAFFCATLLTVTTTRHHSEVKVKVNVLVVSFFCLSPYVYPPSAGLSRPTPPWSGDPAPAAAAASSHPPSSCPSAEPRRSAAGPQPHLCPPCRGGSASTHGTPFVPPSVPTVDKKKKKKKEFQNFRKE